ncbi:MAG: hypothetical protein IKZ25_00935 [Clostridia bacterium]|nr:hypothetical protein [Clostridia bacterium]
MFSKDIEKICAYCEYGTKLQNNDVLCEKKGIMPENAKCRKFLYDPTKRIPKKRPEMPSFSIEKI